MSPLVGCRKVLGWHQVGQFLPWLYKQGLLHYSYLGGALFLVVLSVCLQAKNADCCKFVRKRAKVVGNLLHVSSYWGSNIVHIKC